MTQRSRVAWLMVTALVSGILGCGSDRHGAATDSPQERDPARQQVQALQRVALQMEADLQTGGGQLEGLADLLEQRLTQEDVSVLAGNYLAMLEAYRTQSPWQPDEEYYALVDRLRDLPFLSDLPSRTSEAATDEKGLAVQTSAIFLANVKPSCAFSCEAQGALYALLDYGAGELKAYCMDLVFSGVDCLQDAAKMGRCVASKTCTWGDFTLFVGGCASLSVNVALEVSGASKVKTAYVFLKKVLTIWSVGALTSSFADWVSGCHDFQATSCPASSCAPSEQTCLAANGAGSSCCPPGSSCADCQLCQVPCGIDSCCAAGQRCDAGQCLSCTSSCGPTCCGAKEICANPELGVCAACDNPCGLSCCPAGATCLESMHECCEVPCGNGCCAPGEACLGTPAGCCDNPCGDECCAAGETCDLATMTCGSPSGGCDDAPAIDCPGLCAQAIQEAIAKCAAMGGTLESTDPAGCVANCRCLIAAVPELSACLFIGPACPGCDEVEGAMERCGQSVVPCKVPQGQ